MNVVINSSASSSSAIEAQDVIRPKVHLAYLDGIRALAALYVVMHHAARYAFENALREHPDHINHITYSFFAYGGYAVILFIVLSGFCLMLPVAMGDGTVRGGAVHFYWKRARRILPTYYFAVGFSLLATWLIIGGKTNTPWDTCIHISPFNFLTHFLLLQDLFPSTAHGINYVLWSVSVEWRIYFLFPLLVWGWRRFGAGVTTIAVVMATFVSYGILHHTRYVSFSSYYLSFFALGMLAAGVAYSRNERLSAWRERVPWLLVNIGTILLFLAPQALGHPDGFGAALGQFLVAIWSASLLVLSARAKANFLKHALSWKPLVFIGTFSYSLYLMHPPLLQIFWRYGVHPHHLTPQATFYALFLIGLPIIVGFSYLFSLAFERPFLSAVTREATKRSLETSSVS